MAYLTWSIIFGIIWLILYVNRPDLRSEIIFASLLFMPFGLTQPLFVPEYWNPIVLFQLFGFFDVESMIWCFFTGGIVAVLYEEIFRMKMVNIKNNQNTRYHRYLTYVFMILAVIFLILINEFTTFSVLWSLLILIIFGFIYFAYCRHDLIKKSLISGVLFTIIYVVSLLFVNFIFPEFTTDQWNIGGSIGIRYFSIVIEEYFYAFLFGIFWSVVYEEIKNIKLTALKRQRTLLS